MKQKIPDIISQCCFSCFSVLNDAEIAVIMMGDDAYRDSLNLEDDESPCWVMDSGETQGFVGWNPQCIPTIDYIAWKLGRLELIRRGEINEL